MKPHARDVHRVRLTPYRGPGGSKGGADPPSADADLADVYDRIAALEGVASTALPPGLAVLSGQLGGPAGLHGDYDPSRLAALPPGAAVTAVERVPHKGRPSPWPHRSRAEGGTTLVSMKVVDCAGPALYYRIRYRCNAAGTG